MIKTISLFLSYGNLELKKVKAVSLIIKNDYFEKLTNENLKLLI